MVLVFSLRHIQHIRKANYTDYHSARSSISIIMLSLPFVIPLLTECFLSFYYSQGCK
ncbi:hypothetical protein DsansV1_C15g0132111 [Dioscorea sansibarensis]